jgi:hypothetical protein
VPRTPPNLTPTPTPHPRQVALAACAALGRAATCPPALNATGNHLPLSPDALTPKMPGVGYNVTSADASGFTAAWAAPARGEWTGSFKATGVVPNSINSSPNPTVYDFKTLPQAALPKGSFFIFSDVDHGSGPETIRVRALDAAGAPITSPWLGAPAAVWGKGAAGGAPAAGDLPSFAFDAAMGAYTVDGGTIAGNPTAAFALPSLVPIATLEVLKTRTNNGFGIAAPVRAQAGAREVVCTLAFFLRAGTRRAGQSAL